MIIDFLYQSFFLWLCAEALCGSRETSKDSIFWISTLHENMACQKEFQEIPTACDVKILQRKAILQMARESDFANKNCLANYVDKLFLQRKTTLQRKLLQKMRISLPAV